MFENPFKMKVGKPFRTQMDTLATYAHVLHYIVGLKLDDNICKPLELYGAKPLSDLINMAKDDIETLGVTADKGNSEILQCVLYVPYKNTLDTLKMKGLVILRLSQTKILITTASISMPPTPYQHYLLLG